MLEIILIISISRKIAAMMKAKGRSATGYVFLFVILWIGGEVGGAIVGAVLAEVRNPGMADRNGPDFTVYGFALAGAAIGATIGYVIASSVPALDRSHLDRDDDRYDDRRRDRDDYRDSDRDDDRDRDDYRRDRFRDLDRRKADDPPPLRDRDDGSFEDKRR